jgi:hypothetical protein
MAKAKKRTATLKKSSKSGKASAKPSRKKVVKRATPKKPPPQAASKTTPRKAPRKLPKREMPVIEDTVIDVIDEPVPGVVRVREYETIAITAPKRRAGPTTEE